MPKNADASPCRSTSIALTSDETRVVIVNREANSVSIIQVKDKNGNDVTKKNAEILVGEEQHCVAVHSSDGAAYVTNATVAPWRFRKPRFPGDYRSNPEEVK